MNRNALTLSFCLLSTTAFADSLPPLPADPHALVVARLQYEGNSFGSAETFPNIFNAKNVASVQGSIHLDGYLPTPGSPMVSSLALLPSLITASFHSRLEGALMLSVDGNFLTYIGYDAPLGSNGAISSYVSGANLQGNTNMSDRVVALISPDGSINLTPQNNAYSGDLPRAAITVDGSQFYMVGNSDATLYADGTGPGNSIGARYGWPGSISSHQLGFYVATDRTDQTVHIKDNNFRGIGIYNGNLYVSKGSGGNGDQGLFQVHNGTGNGLPTGTGNTITQLFSAPATDPVTGAASPITPYGFWFANPTTVYIANEGYSNLDKDKNLIPDPNAGIQKWTLVNGAWQLAYTLQAGLNLYEPQTIQGYPVPTYTTGLRAMTGKINGDGTVTLYAITGQYSTIAGGGPDPNKLVAITDSLSASSLPATESFVTLQTSSAGQVFRGVAFAPCGC